jgi:SSS family solute:Na+ symporter
VAIYTICGGMLSVLVTDFLQFVVMSVGLIVVTVLILNQIGWQTMVDAVRANMGEGGFNPLANEKQGWPWLIFQILVNTAATLTWQTNIARVLAAKDARTGRRIYTQTSFFFVCRFLIPALWGIAAMVYLTEAGRPSNTLHAMPLFLSQVLPTGILGLLIAAMLAADMSTDSSYMLTWGSIIYNDLLAPFRRRTWSERTGLLCNRLIVSAIGLFLLIYGLWYKIPGDVWSYLTVTGSIYLSSISILLIACCYWNKANDWGAFGAIVAGSVFPIAYLVLEKIPDTKPLAESIGPHWSGIAAFVAAAVAMVVGSLCKPVGLRKSVSQLKEDLR